MVRLSESRRVQVVEATSRTVLCILELQLVW